MNRVFGIRTTIIGTGVILIIRLFFIQVANDKYLKAAEDNIVQKQINYPYRGLISDRNDSLIVFNAPVFDLMAVPREVSYQDTAELENILHIPVDSLTSLLGAAPVPHFPVTVLPELDPGQIAEFQEDLVDFPGFQLRPRTIRGYSEEVMPHVLGYIGEISQDELLKDSSLYYAGGDLIGIAGVEKTYESALRGTRGVTYALVDARGVKQGKFREGIYDTLSVPGKNIQLTIDISLQQYVERLMEGKKGSVVALDPATGEVLALVSVPNYRPSMLAGSSLGKNYAPLSKRENDPLFNRAIQASYPPGSMFKTIQALIAMQEGVVRPDQNIYCPGGLIGDLAPPGKYDVKRAITLSSNNYFFTVFRKVVLQDEDPNIYEDSRIGLERWRDYVTAFGLGKKLGIDLPNEASGFVPDTDYYDNIYGERRWKFSNVYSLSIGQGELQVTPLQMANLGALLANRGHYFTPHILKSIADHPVTSWEKKQIPIDSIYFEHVIGGMEQVVAAGSGRRAFIPDIAVCGKTSTVENAGEDHSGFMGFAPKHQPRIAVAVYVENAGWGGRAAASTASLIMEKYLTGKVKRIYLEDYVLNGNFL